ncbi:neuronal PAS domain-containing protein 3-like [Lytechinus pictus]|uniref:neuronal PAS domain-containing protein 3-like n=1 Tax=Lytechinus pictus TaxID=7653 RepID=UPI0030BA2359
MGEERGGGRGGGMLLYDHNESSREIEGGEADRVMGQGKARAMVDYQNKEGIAAIRKERSRDAARSRRGKENYEFYELAKLLPLPAAITSQLDKASIIRLTIGYLHMRHFCLQGDPPWHNYPENISTPTNSSRHLSVLQGRYPHVQSGTNAIAREVYEHHLGSHILQSLDGYLFALYRDGRFLYISETVSIYLGLSQVELMGCSVFDYVHPGDHAELAEQLGMKLPPNKTSSSPSSANADGNSTSGSAAGSPAAIGPSTIQDDVTLNMTATSDRMERSFLIRMKSTLTKRGVHFKSSGYKVIHVTGALRPEISLSQYNHHPPNVLGFVGVGYSLPPPTISEVRLDPTMFMCKVDLDFTITFCEAKIGDFLDHSADSIIGKSFYSYIHAQDIANVRSSHQDLLNKGQTITKYYRWMLMEGGYVWVQTTATLCYAKNSNDSSFIFINQVLSHVEHGNIAMDISQIPSLASDEHIELLGTSPTRNKTSPCRHSGDEADGVSDKQLRTVGDSNNNSKGHQGLLEGKTRKRPQSPERRKSKKQRGAQITRNEPTGNHSDIEHKSEISGRESKRKANARLLAQKPKATPDVIPKQVIIRSDSPNEKTLTVLGERGDFRESEDYAKRSKERLQHTEDVVKEVMEDKGIHHSPPAMSPINHMQASSSLLALSVRNASRHEEEDIVRVPSGSWENPPNRELPPDHNGMIPSPDTNHTRLSLAPMNTVPKGVFTTPSPKTPDSLLTPPLSDSAKNQFSLPPVSSLTSPKARPTNTDSITPIFTTESSISRYISPSSSKHETVYPIPSPLTQNPSVESLDSMRNMVKQEPSFYNARMLGVPSSYTNMAAYANYGQYNNLQHYNATVNLTSRAYQAAAASYDASMYKNYHTTTDLPIDLSYNGVTGIPIMSPANGPYFPAASRLQYNITDGQLSLNCDKTGLDKSKTPSV